MLRLRMMSLISARVSLGKVESKSECIDALVKTKIDFKMDHHSTVKLHGDTAVVHARTTSHMMQEGKPAEVPLDIMQVWVKKGNAWQMIARHTLRLPPNR